MINAQGTDSSVVDTAMQVQLPVPVSEFMALDHEYDRGEAVDLSWKLSVNDDGSGRVTGYDIYRSHGGDGKFILIASVPPGFGTFVDKDVKSGDVYTYKIATTLEAGASAFIEADPVIPNTEIINWNLLNLFIIGFIVCGSVIFFIAHAKRGKKLFIRKIAGLEAVDEAIGRATEMGRPILFVPGINDMDDVQTIAGITILARVAKVVAEYDIKINMPVSRSIVMTTARETIRDAYAAVGRPDAYNDDMVRYITDEQFGYVAAVDGIMVREKPATCFYLGAFFAESLILAETGNSIGAIQIGGTAMPAQLPFFVAACDYTLIGEELFAASAYLSNDPKQLGSLKGQDVGKSVAMAAIILGVLSETISQAWGGSLFFKLAEYMQRFFTISN
nr:fibronectin type III domain-containing protein [candidate division Zixibacteria bacterium]